MLQIITNETAAALELLAQQQSQMKLPSFKITCTRLPPKQRKEESVGNSVKLTVTSKQRIMEKL